MQTKDRVHVLEDTTMCSIREEIREGQRLAHADFKSGAFLSCAYVQMRVDLIPLVSAMSSGQSRCTHSYACLMLERKERLVCA